MSAVQGKVELDGTRQALEQLGLEFAAASVGELLSEAVRDDLPAHRFLDKVLATELTQRDERRVKTSLRLSGLPTGQTLDSFDWGFQPGFDQRRLETLARLPAASSTSTGLSFASYVYSPGTPMVTLVTDRSGNETEYTFGSVAVPTKVEVFTRGLRSGEPTSFVTTYAVNATTGLVDSVTYPRGSTTDYEYDSNFNLVEMRQKETATSTSTDRVWQWEYGAYSQVTEHTDPLGNVTTYTVDSSGNTTRIDRPTVTSSAWTGWRRGAPVARRPALRRGARAGRVPSRSTSRRASGLARRR